MNNFFLCFAFLLHEFSGYISFFVQFCVECFKVLNDKISLMAGFLDRCLTRPSGLLRKELFLNYTIST